MERRTGSVSKIVTRNSVSTPTRNIYIAISIYAHPWKINPKLLMTFFEWTWSYITWWSMRWLWDYTSKPCCLVLMTYLYQWQPSKAMCNYPNLQLFSSHYSIPTLSRKFRIMNQITYFHNSNVILIGWFVLKFVGEHILQILVPTYDFILNVGRKYLQSDFQHSSHYFHPYTSRLLKF